MKKLSDFRYKEFYIASLIMVLFGLFLDSFTNNINGLIKIISSPSILISDYMEIAGVGASFINAGLMLLFSVFISNKSGARLTGAHIAGLFTLTGFSFFGKNLINSIPLMLGVYLYTKVKSYNVANFMHVMCFVTGISPLVSLFYFALGFNPILGFALGFFVGILVGFIIVPLSSSMLNFHEGYCLYNVGFTLGIVAIVFAGIFRMFDREIPKVSMIYQGNDMYPFVFLLSLSIIFILYGLINPYGIKNYKKEILSESGRLLTDFTINSDKHLVVFNMGLMGLISIAFVIISAGKFNGPIVGGILTIMGFAAFGKHPRNVIPIMAGVFLTSTINKYDPSSTQAVLTALFATTLAPIAGDFGIVVGLLAGFLHKAVATNIGFAHGGINLYNNGLAGGMVAAILVPIFKNLRERHMNE